MPRVPKPGEMQGPGCRASTQPAGSARVMSSYRHGCRRNRSGILRARPAGPLQGCSGGDRVSFDYPEIAWVLERAEVAPLFEEMRRAGMSLGERKRLCWRVSVERDRAGGLGGAGHEQVILGHRHFLGCDDVSCWSAGTHVVTSEAQVGRVPEMPAFTMPTVRIERCLCDP
jgi:hypothetical protein